MYEHREEEVMKIDVQRAQKERERARKGWSKEKH